MMKSRALLWAVGALGVYACAARVFAAFVLSHTHHRALGAVAVTLPLAFLGLAAARVATRLSRASLPLGLAVVVACAGATLLGVLASQAIS